MKRILPLIILGLVLSVASCGGGSSSSSNYASGNSFTGVVTGTTTSGSISFNIAEEANTNLMLVKGLSVLAAGTYDITGSYDAGGLTAVLTGTATVADDGSVTILIIGTSGAVTIAVSGSYDIATDTFNGTVWLDGTEVANFDALSGQEGIPTNYCGSFNGDSSGTWNFTVGANAGSALTGSFAGTDASGSLTGTRALSNIVKISFSGGSAQGSIDNDSAMGTWSAGTENGQWTGGPC